jgi:hypothetical protein
VTLQHFAATRVRSRIQNASSSPLIVETERGKFVAKLRGAGQGVPALVAEIVVAEIAERLGLPVPERTLIELGGEIESDDRNDELADLLRNSVGTNLGLRWMEGAKQPRESELSRIDDEFAARVLWLDGLVMNPDRTRANPNILLWKGQPWLIDHGAALPFQHDWGALTEDSPREPVDYASHVFGERVALIEQLDERLAETLGREQLSAAVEEIPEALLSDANPGESPARARARYQAFLWKRLKAPRLWAVPARAT